MLLELPQVGGVYWKWKGCESGGCPESTVTDTGGEAATGLCAATAWHRELHKQPAGLHSDHRYTFTRNDPTDVGR